MIPLLLARHWRLLACMALIGLAAFFVFSKGYKAGLATGRAELTAFQVEVGGRILEANRAAEAAAADFEAWKRTHRPKVITVTREVDRVLEAHPDWSRVRLPDGVRDALAAAAAELDSGQPDGAVPAVPAGRP